MPQDPSNRDTPDRPDFARLLVTHQHRLRMYVRSLVFRESDVDEIVQEVASKAFTRFEQYDADRPFDAWLITLARFEVMTYLKKRKRERLVFSTETAERLMQTMEDRPDRWQQYTLDSLERCLKRLEEDDRQLIRMRYNDGSTGKRIASMLDVSESTICRRLAKIYGQLMVCIKRAIHEGEVA